MRADSAQSLSWCICKAQGFHSIDKLRCKNLSEKTLQAYYKEMQIEDFDNKDSTTLKVYILADFGAAASPGISRLNGSAPVFHG